MVNSFIPNKAFKIALLVYLFVKLSFFRLKAQNNLM